MPLQLKKKQVTVAVPSGDSDPLPALVYGTWGVHSAIHGSGWAVTHLPSGMAATQKLKSQKQGVAFLEAMGQVDDKLLWAKTESDVMRYSKEIQNILRNPPQVSKGKTPAKPLISLDFDGILRDEGLKNLGGRYGKAGDFWGIKGASRVVAVGRRDVLLNEFLVGISREDQIKRPDTRWTLFKGGSKSKMTEDLLRKWALWAKQGVTMVELRDMARKEYEAKKAQGEKNPVVILTGGRARRSSLIVASRYLRRRKTAGWWSLDPMGGDTPLDYLGAIQRMEPGKAVQYIAKQLRSKEFSIRYSAMGVWDVVMSSKIPVWVEAFSTLTPKVIAAAKKGIPSGDEWAGEKEPIPWLRIYSQGKSSGKLRGTKFKPTKGMKGPIWYIERTDGGNMGGTVDVGVKLRNQYTDETKDISEYMEGPLGDIEDVSTTNYGGKGDKQQSIMVTVVTVNEEGNSMDWEKQVEVDSASGEFDEDSLENDWEMTG